VRWQARRFAYGGVHGRSVKLSQIATATADTTGMNGVSDQ
jgi:hypothetical protein